jgi:ribose 1,5-bisphosphokinase PhnN
LNGQLVPIASQFADWYLDLIAGMKHEIETQLRLRGRDNARQITPRLLRFETFKPGLK